MERSVETGGVRMRYTVEGIGNVAAVLMHGWGCDHTTLLSVEKLLATMGFTVYNVDFPGFGASPEPPAVWGVEEYTSAVESLLDAENVTRPILLGHSFGGRVGILLASRRKVRKLVLVDAAGVKPRRSLKYYFKVYTFKAAKRLAPLVLGQTRGQAAIDKWRARAGSSDYNGSTPRMRAILSRVVNQDLRYAMPSVSCPTLLVWGKNDTATPLSDARVMERLIPDAGLVAMDGAGHYSFLDNPYQFAAVIKCFLKDDAAEAVATNE